MNFFKAMFVWIAISAVLGLGIYLAAAKGNLWLLAISAVTLVGMVGKIGCSTH